MTSHSQNELSPLPGVYLTLWSWLLAAVMFSYPSQDRQASCTPSPPLPFLSPMHMASQTSARQLTQNHAWKYLQLK